MESSSDVENIIRVALPLVQAAMFGYAAFWGFNIRHALYVRLYRNQALGIGLIGLAFVFVTIANNVIDFIYSNNSNLAGNLVVPVYYVGFIVIFYWIDASVLAARRSDPLLRDTFHWTRLRVLLWSVMIILVALAMSVDAYSLLTGNPIPTNLQPLPGINFLLILATGAALLPVSARRSKDMSFRKHLEWFGIFAAVFFGFIVETIVINLPTVTNTTVISTLEAVVPLTIAAYFLSRSARSTCTVEQAFIRRT